MNEKIKMFFGGFISCFVFIASIILTRIFKKKRFRFDSDVGARIEQAGNTCKSTERTIEKIGGEIESSIGIEQDVKRTNEQLKLSIDASRNIIEELKQRNERVKTKTLDK